MKEIILKSADKIENAKRVSTEIEQVFCGSLNPIPSQINLEVKYRQDRRSSRLIELYFLSQAYHKYQLFNLCKCALNNSTEYNSSENTSMLMNTIFDLETTPSDFIQTQDEANNELLEKYLDYKSFLDKSDLDKLVVDAFCKASEHNFGTMLKINSVPFMFQIEVLIDYNLGLITIKQLRESFVDYCIFTKKTKKINTRLFKKIIHSIEKLYSEISTKRTLRQINKI